MAIVTCWTGKPTDARDAATASPVADKRTSRRSGLGESSFSRNLLIGESNDDAECITMAVGSTLRARREHERVRSGLGMAAQERSL